MALNLSDFRGADTRGTRLFFHLTATRIFYLDFIYLTPVTPSPLRTPLICVYNAIVHSVVQRGPDYWGGGSCLKIGIIGVNTLFANIPLCTYLQRNDIKISPVFCKKKYGAIENTCPLYFCRNTCLLEDKVLLQVHCRNVCRGFELTEG